MQRNYLDPHLKETLTFEYLNKRLLAIILFCCKIGTTHDDFKIGLEDCDTLICTFDWFADAIYTSKSKSNFEMNSSLLWPEI